jgi:hypothetical protein
MTTISRSSRQSLVEAVATSAEAPADHRNPAKKIRYRIPAPKRLRVIQAYALGQNQTEIAKRERLNRETVHQIVHSPEMTEFTEEMRERWRALSGLAIETLRRRLEQGDAALALRVLESNGIIPPKGRL